MDKLKHMILDYFEDYINGLRRGKLQSEKAYENIKEAMMAVNYIETYEVTGELKALMIAYHLNNLNKL